jgi:hypothetical protein
MTLNLITDAYERKARLYPALVLVVPVVATVVAIVAAKLSALQSVAATLAGCGGAFLLSQLARDAGKNGEQALFARWGGMPSVAIFRHRDTRIDAITKARYHKKLTSVVTGTKVPSAAQEQADPTSADQTYTAWSTYLRTHTRDTKKYPLVFHELVNYGYRRNVWGLRSIGIVTSALSCAIAGTWCYLQYHAGGGISEELVGACALSLVFLLLWVFRFSAEWVRIPADAYAQRLAEAVETMDTKTAAAKKEARSRPVS